MIQCVIPLWLHRMEAERYPDRECIDHSAGGIPRHTGPLYRSITVDGQFSGRSETMQPITPYIRSCHMRIVVIALSYTLNETMTGNEITLWLAILLMNSGVD